MLCYYPCGERIWESKETANRCCTPQEDEFNAAEAEMLERLQRKEPDRV